MAEIRNDAMIEKLRELYPQLSEAELAEAWAQVSRYLKVVRSVYESLKNSPELQEKYEALNAEYEILTSTKETDNFKTKGS